MGQVVALEASPEGVTLRPATASETAAAAGSAASSSGGNGSGNSGAPAPAQPLPISKAASAGVIALPDCDASRGGAKAAACAQLERVSCAARLQGACMPAWAKEHAAARSAWTSNAFGASCLPTWQLAWLLPAPATPHTQTHSHTPMLPHRHAHPRWRRLAASGHRLARWCHSAPWSWRSARCHQASRTDTASCSRSQRRRPWRSWTRSVQICRCAGRSVRTLAAVAVPSVRCQSACNSACLLQQPPLHA